MAKLTGRRPALLAAAVLLALGGGTAITVAALRTPPSVPEAAGVPATAPDSVPPAASAAPAGELTSGPQMSTSPPVRVSIPALHVAVPVVGLGQMPDGSMQVPADAKTVGWYTRAPTPGSLGPAVLAGHVDFKKQPGTFAELSRLKAGDPVTVNRQDGSTATFAVTKVERYAKNRFPSEAVYGPINHAGLRLITCGGDFDSSSGHYRDNIVVYAVLRTTQAG
jgi:sortase (surface protein transpeptidase)